VLVEIREHVETDLDSYCEWQSDPAVATFVSWLPKTRAQSAEDLREAIRQQVAKARKKYFFAIVDRSSQEVIGDVGFTIIDKGVADCGWFICRRFWGRGYATQAVHQMIAMAFVNAGLHCLVASCVKENLASQRVMKKCGFIGVGETQSRRQYSLSKEEWQKRRLRNGP
jgi:[ribosomal protein S5]-alanine N-acetyltransferase